MSGNILTVKREPPTPLSAASMEVTLAHFGDQNAAEGGYMPRDQVRQLTVNAVADTGVINLVIDEETREKLGLRVEETVEVALAGDIKVPGGMTEYVELRWKDRHFFCAAWNLRFPFSPAKKALPWANTPCSA